ncbi:hypothetical protein ACLB2K_024162 [Fragaria x ananassa]
MDAIDPVSLVHDHNIKGKLVELGISVQSYNADLLHEPWEVYDAKGQRFTTFKEYWDKCLNMERELVAFLPLSKLLQATGMVAKCSIEELGLENEIEKSSSTLLGHRAWSPSWSQADKALTEFFDSHLLDYAKNKTKLWGNSTSLLSPYLHFGDCEESFPGSLPDGHELERLDSPEVQGSKFNPEGEYVWHWLPELARLPTEWIHHPWDMPDNVLKVSGVELEFSYPRPIIGIDLARERLTEALFKVWEMEAAAKAANLNGTNEVVVDKSDRIESLPIPKVTLRNNTPCATHSSDDQKVPFMSQF